MRRPKLREGSLTPGGTPILGHIRDVRPEWVSFPGRKSADGCKFFLPKRLGTGHNFDTIVPGNGWFPLNWIKPIVVQSISIVNSLRMGLFLCQL